MALQITIDDIYIDNWSVDLNRQCVTINYSLTSSGSVWKEDNARFWVTLPTTPIEGVDFQLPITYAQTLLNLTNDAATALKTYWEIT